MSFGKPDLESIAKKISHGLIVKRGELSAFTSGELGDYVYKKISGHPGLLDMAIMKGALKTTEALLAEEVDNKLSFASTIEQAYRRGVSRDDIRAIKKLLEARGLISEAQRKTSFVYNIHSKSMEPVPSEEATL